MGREVNWRHEVAIDPAFKRLIQNRNLKPTTQQSYLDGVLDFCRFFDKSPSEIVEWFRGMSEDEVVETFKTYFIGRKDKLSSKSLILFSIGVRALLIENGVKTIDRVSREISRTFRRCVGRVRTLLKRDMITKPEIIRILKVAGLREKALITMMASSGLRIGAAVSLKLENIKDNLWDLNLPCYQVEVPEEYSKEGEPYVTFISWEAAEYLRDWLKFREQNGETIRPSSYLFPTRWNDSPITPKRFQNIWRKLCDEAGIDSRPVQIKGRTKVRHNIRPHSLRKFFRTTLTISGVDPKVAEALMGHSLSKFGVESIYDFAVSNLDYLRSEYMKALDNLLLLRKPRGFISSETEMRIEELERELGRRDMAIKRLQKQIEDLNLQLIQVMLALQSGDRKLLEQLPFPSAFTTSGKKILEREEKAEAEAMEKMIRKKRK